jgi:ABC-type Fe3+-hydroxamate transport system substrate-binding protein
MPTPTRDDRELLESNPLWSTLPAVQADRVVYVPDVLWGTSYSVLALETQLADIEDALLG